VIAKVLRQNCGDVDFLAAKAGPELAAIAKSLVVIRRSLTPTQLDYMYSYCVLVKKALEQLIKSALAWTAGDWYNLKKRPWRCWWHWMWIRIRRWRQSGFPTKFPGRYSGQTVCVEVPWNPGFS
jgi:hypothetical protein